jgi:hypothetical protein
MRRVIVKVAYLLQKGIEIKGGAALCAAGLLRNLRDRFGHSCVILTPHPTPARDVLDGIEVWAYRDLDELQDFVRLLRPDIVIGSARPAVDAVASAPVRRAGRHHVRSLR